MRKILVCALILYFGIEIGMGMISMISKWWQPAPVQVASHVNDLAAFQQQTNHPGAPKPNELLLKCLLIQPEAMVHGGWDNG